MSDFAGQRPGRPALHASTSSAGEVRARARRPPRRRRVPPLRRGPAQGRPPPRPRVPRRRRPARQRRAARDQRPQGRRSRSSPASRTAGRRAAASTARTSRTRRSAARSGCAPAAAPSRPRTSSSSPARRRPRSPGSGRWRRATAPMPGRVRVLVVPGGGRPSSGRLRFDQLVPTRTRSRRSPTGSRSARVIGTRANVEPPVYRGITVVAKLRARPRVNPTRLQEEALAGALRVLPPDHRRPRRHRLAVRASGQRRRGVLGAAGPARAPRPSRTRGSSAPTRSPGSAASRPSGSSSRPHALVFSYEHQVLVEGA